jgi:hypothetical protein
MPTLKFEVTVTSQDEHDIGELIKPVSRAIHQAFGQSIGVVIKPVMDNSIKLDPVPVAAPVIHLQDLSKGNPESNYSIDTTKET